MIASFVEENHENWDQFLHEFAFALRTAVNETTNKTPAKLFLGRKIITLFSKLINVTEDTKYVGRNIERLFDEARRNMRKKFECTDRQTDTISSDSPVETLYDEQEFVMGRIDRIKGSLKSIGKPLVRKVRGVDHGRSPLQVHPGCLITGSVCQLKSDPGRKVVVVIPRPARPEQQRDDATNKRRDQSGRIKPLQGDLAHTIYEAVYKKATEFLRSRGTSKSTAYLTANYGEASVWKRWMEIRYIGEFNRQKPGCIVSLSSRYEQVKKLKQVTGGL
ncbi:uncharacterized protein TNCV_1235661 [Trichonephila clavipes]|nr:uncharacterized protein TNCV_1235661 [Trichonephila clavipes]